MKRKDWPLKWFGFLILCFFVISCQKSEPGGSPGNQAAEPNADSISNRLLFLSQTKNQGKAPQGGSGSSLKISFEDTLFLIDQVLQPMSFLHGNTLENVAGVYLQVHVRTSAGLADASYYYDVPELNATVTNDSISILLIGINPSGLNLPLHFEMTIIPYDKDGNPIAESIRPVTVLPHENPNTAICGLDLPAGEVWDWVLSYSIRDTVKFVSSPSIVFGELGQIINGSCCAGISIYGICPGKTLPNAKLHFASFYQIASETFLFDVSGTYLRQTIELGANPLPLLSDFCGSGEGVIEKYAHQTTYSGNYSIVPATIPPDLQMLHDSLRLAILSSASTPPASGFGNGGGIIHQFDCDRGFLVLIQPDIEGAKEHLYKFYKRRTVGQVSIWFPFVR